MLVILACVLFTVVALLANRLGQHFSEEKLMQRDRKARERKRAHALMQNSAAPKILHFFDEVVESALRDQVIFQQ